MLIHQQHNGLVFGKVPALVGTEAHPFLSHRCRAAVGQAQGARENSLLLLPSFLIAASLVIHGRAHQSLDESLIAAFCSGHPVAVLDPLLGEVCRKLPLGE